MITSKECRCRELLLVMYMIAVVLLACQRQKPTADSILLIPSSSSRNSKSETVDCPALLQEVRNGHRWDPNQGRIYARFTKLHPQFWISLHTFDYDKVRFGTLHWGKYYEKQLSKAFTEVLEQEPSGIVVDVGGNIGWFSILSAALGHDVYTFEPNPTNVLRLCESICLNGWITCPTVGFLYSGDSNPHGTISIHTLGLKDEAGSFWLEQNPFGFSTGAGKLVTKASNQSASIEAKVVTLDQIADQLGWHGDIAALKVDVEGLEHEVIMGGTKLLASKRIKNVFTEGNVGEYHLRVKFLDLARHLVGQGYVLHKLGGHMGPGRSALTDLPYSNALHVNYTKGILWGCRGFVNQGRSQCNLWWKLAT
jgi:FkbM family methyltransferase